MTTSTMHTWATGMRATGTDLDGRTITGILNGFFAWNYTTGRNDRVDLLDDNGIAHCVTTASLRTPAHTGIVAIALAPTAAEQAAADRATVIRWRGAWRAVLGQHQPDEHEPQYCQRCTDCTGDRMLHPCDTHRDAANALEEA